MSYVKRMKVKMCDLPLLLELEGPNGEEVPYELLPKKGEIGMFLNKVSQQLWKLIRRK